MNITVIVIEIIILTALFTAAVLWGSKNPVDVVYDMPQPIIDRCLELGLIDETKKAGSKETKLKKLTAAVIVAWILIKIISFMPSEV